MLYIYVFYSVVDLICRYFLMISFVLELFWNGDYNYNLDEYWIIVLNWVKWFKVSLL